VGSGGFEVRLELGCGWDMGKLAGRSLLGAGAH